MAPIASAIATGRRAISACMRSHAAIDLHHAVPIVNVIRGQISNSSLIKVAANAGDQRAIPNRGGVLSAPRSF